MNMDFHYYGTFCAARIAGFGAPESEEIAWAAQMVDDCTENLLKDCGLTGGNYEATSEGTLENLLDNLKYWSYNPDNTALRKIRRIWIPFHFLPGNLDTETYQQVYTGNKTWSPGNGPELLYFDENTDGADFKCLCLHNSTLVQNMIEDTIHMYQQNYHTNPEKRQFLLHLIGIRMHVLADTWAHEFFVGTPNYWINDVSEINLINEDGIDISKIRTPSAPSCYSIAYLGHGRLGHYPDCGLLRYKYRPRWLGVDSNPCEKDNVHVFLSAFCQMTDALGDIIHGQRPFLAKDYSRADMNSSIDFAHLNLQNLLGNSPSSFPVYKKGENLTNPVKLKLFQDAAKHHRDMVCAVLNSNGIHTLS